MTIRSTAAFLNVAISIYRAIHIYALSKVWLAFPHAMNMTVTEAWCDGCIQYIDKKYF